MTPRLRYISLLECSGYGLSALEYVRALSTTDRDLAWNPLPWHPRGGYRWFGCRPSRLLAERTFGTDRGELDLIREQPAADIQVLHLIPELWPGLVGVRCTNVGYTVWETDRLPRHWPQLLRRVDRILVPCEFNREMFAEATGRPVSVVPHICRRIFRPPDEAEIAEFRKRLGLDADRHLFYSINAWNVRKAPWDLVNAYLAAFDGDDPVALVMKTDDRGPDHPENPRPTAVREQIDNIRARYPNPASIILVDRRLPERDIELLHLTCDTFVSLARSEGWGIGMFDAAWFGNPVICTGWGGHLDYLAPQHSTLLEYRMEPVVNAAGYPSYSPDQRWARADPDHAVEALRRHAAEAHRFRERAAPLAAEIERRYNADAVAQILGNALEPG